MGKAGREKERNDKVQDGRSKQKRKSQRQGRYGKERKGRVQKEMAGKARNYEGCEVLRKAKKG
jgi:hypothetical protein